MTPLEQALDYASRGWRVFPCDQQRHPNTDHGFYSASADPVQIRRWWNRHPNALIGFWPGASDIAVLDIDMKNGKDGLATFIALEGCPIMPPTPTVRTQSGGWHLHYQMPKERIGSTNGAKGRGIGIGLDWRGDTGYAILPTPGSGYRWGHWTYDTCAPLPVPPALMPKPAPTVPRSSVEPPQIDQHSLNGAMRFLMNTAEGDRNDSLYWTAKRFSEAVAAGLIDTADARSMLKRAGTAIGLTPREVTATINSALRETGHA